MTTDGRTHHSRVYWTDNTMECIYAVEKMMKQERGTINTTRDLVSGKTQVMMTGEFFRHLALLAASGLDEEERDED